MGNTSAKIKINFGWLFGAIYSLSSISIIITITTILLLPTTTLND